MRKISITFVVVLPIILLISSATLNPPQLVSSEENKTSENSEPYTSFTQDTVWKGTGILASNASNSQEGAKLCSDGNGGAIIAWHDYRSSNRDIYAQHINSLSVLEWTENGTVICNNINDQRDPEIIEDENGGAIISWIDNRGGDDDIYAQRINGSRTFWRNNGTAICNATDVQNSHRMCSDNDEGAIIVWADWRNGVDYDIYAQRIDKNGNNIWGPNGTVICNATNDQTSPQICSDGNGGAIISWVDNRGGDEDIYAQKINGSGTLWLTNGTVICNATNNQNSPQLYTDQNGGAIITWADARSVSTGYDVYSQLINSQGIVQWLNNGTAICNATNNQNFPQICNDDYGGAIISWADNRSGNEDIYVQRISRSGNTLWTNNGTLVCNEGTYAQNSTQITIDNRGGAFIMWIDYRFSYPNIYIQAFDSDGKRHFAENGTIVCQKLRDNFSVQMISDGDMGVIISIVDNRSGIDYDVYVQKIVYYLRPPSFFGGEKADPFQEAIFEFSEAFINIAYILIIIFSLIGAVAILIKIRKRLTEESRKWG